MADIIQLLPDAVANQIAAGEVIQRPASVIKELVENAVDAGATSIKVHVKEAGKASIQIIDNGCGMSETDARMAFERHATSKIRSANDLFAIRTLGFRGEALASIAAIAHVELKTKLTDSELGTLIQINGSEIIRQESIQCANGTNFTIKNLFYNVPARRKFLKANSTELRQIINEFQRVALTYPHIEFLLSHNGSEIYHLPSANLRQRIVNIFGTKLKKSLLSIEAETSIAKIYGYIGIPDAAKKRGAEQFFFVNSRYMRHPYFHKAVSMVYDMVLPSEYNPVYFIYLDVDPETIDINIHPTKTEIKFESANEIFKILSVAVKESLGKFNVVPSIDFDTEGKIDLPSSLDKRKVAPPSITINPNYNPFDSEKSEKTSSYSKPEPSELDKDNMDNWQNLYNGLEQNKSQGTERIILDSNIGTNAEMNLKPQTPSSNYFNYKNKYILTPVKSGLMFVNKRRAHERILYENALIQIEKSTKNTQKLLFPATLELSTDDADLIKELLPELQNLGFDMEEFGKNTIKINGTPADISSFDPEELLLELIENFKETAKSVTEQLREQLAQTYAKTAAVGYNKSLTDLEMQGLIDTLFACQVPNYTPDGKLIIYIRQNEDIDKQFERAR